MAEIPYVFKDLGLTQPFDDASDALIAQAVNGGSGTGVFYVGTATSGNKLQDATTPGVDNIVVSIVDATPGGGVEAAHIKLAINLEANLAGASGGASVNLGTEIQYGAPIPVWYQWDNSVGSGDYTEISLQLSTLQEVAI